MSGLSEKALSPFPGQRFHLSGDYSYPSLPGTVALGRDVLIIPSGGSLSLVWRVGGLFEQPNLFFLF